MSFKDIFLCVRPLYVRKYDWKINMKYFRTTSIIFKNVKKQFQLLEVIWGK